MTVKAITILTRTPSLALLNLPSTQQLGLKGFEVYNRNNVFLSRGTDPAIVKKLNDALVRVMMAPTRAPAPGFAAAERLTQAAVVPAAYSSAIVRNR